MKTQQTSFAIIGMRETCAQCAVTIERALARLEGVVAAQVNFATERAIVVYHPGRVSLAQMVRVVQEEGFDLPLTRLVLSVEGLYFATCARTIERILSRSDSVVQVRANLPAQYVELDVLTERIHQNDYAHRLAALGLSVAQVPLHHAKRDLAIRAALMVALAFLSVLSAGAHAGWFEVGLLHAPLIVMLSAIIIAYGIAWRFYRVAFETALHYGEFDPSVVTALVATASLLVGLPLALITPQGIFTTVGFIISILLTTSWFIVRAASLWIGSHLRRSSAHNPSATQPTRSLNSSALHLRLNKKLGLPILASIVAAFGMFTLYLLILTVSQDFSHARQQASQDWFWVSSVALGFGIQIGLCVYLRLLVSTANILGVTAATGAGTTTSTLGMVACCAHHLTNLVPLVALTGASSLSSAIAFLNEWKYAFIALGLVVNVIGIVITLLTIRKSQTRLNMDKSPDYGCVGS